MDTYKKDVKDLFTIQNGINVTIFPMIVEWKFSKVSWDTLKSAYKGPTKVRVSKIQLLRRDFESLWMGDDETIEIFINRVQDLMNALHSYAKQLGDT